MNDLQTKNKEQGRQIVQNVWGIFFDIATMKARRECMIVQVFELTPSTVFVACKYNSSNALNFGISF